jgi:hypothetical protein
MGILSDEPFYQLDSSVRLRFEGTVDAGTAYLFHNRLQQIRQCDEATYRLLAHLRQSPCSLLELSRVGGISVPAMREFADTLVSEGWIRVIERVAEERPPLSVRR